MRLEDIADPALRNRIARKIGAPNRSAIPTSNVEPHFANAPMAEEKVARLNSPCRIHIRSYRRRLTDADGASGKAAIDGLVLCGLLPTDSPEVVKEVSYSQVTLPPKQYAEQTVIEIYEVTK